eukprot:1561826-Amphidinium_carterae.1
MKLTAILTVESQSQEWDKAPTWKIHNCSSIMSIFCIFCVRENAQVGKFAPIDRIHGNVHTNDLASYMALQHASNPTCSLSDDSLRESLGLSCFRERLAQLGSAVLNPNGR